jgi:G-protein signaling modulator 2
MTAVGDHHEALNYAQKHLEISREIGDITGQTTAQMSISDLRKMLEKDLSKSPVADGPPSDGYGRHKRQSMDRMELMTLTPQQRKHSLNTVDEMVATGSSSGESGEPSVEPMVASSSTDFISKSHEDFLDLVSKFQSKRMDDQRCPLNGTENKENRKPMPICGQPMANQMNRQFANTIRDNPSNGNPVRNAGANANNNRNNPSHAMNNHIGSVGQSSQDSQSSSGDHFHDLIDMIAGMQERRMDDQRAALPPVRRNSATNGPESLPQQRNPHSFAANNRNNENSNDLVPRLRAANPQNPRRTVPNRQYSLGANVLPDDDFFEMLMRSQASRLEDQRTLMPGTSSDESSSISRPSTLERPQSVVSTQSNSPQQVL